MDIMFPAFRLAMILGVLLYLGVILFVMIMMHEALLKKKQASEMSLTEIEEA